MSGTWVYGSDPGPFLLPLAERLGTDWLWFDDIISDTVVLLHVGGTWTRTDRGSVTRMPGDLAAVIAAAMNDAAHSNHGEMRVVISKILDGWAADIQYQVQK